MDTMNKDELYHFREKQYDEISRVLTDYEEKTNGVTEEDLYNLLVDIQNNWETIISEV